MWACAIDGCAFGADSVEDLLAHQVEAHDRHECRVCHATVPDGYFAIRHAFDEHSRVDYLEQYDADADDVRRREAVREAVDAAADVEALVERLDVELDDS